MNTEILKILLSFYICRNDGKQIFLFGGNMPKKWFETTKGVINISQLALMLLTPIIMGILLGYFLTEKLGIENWAMAVCVIIGFFAGIAGFISYLFKMANDFDKKG